MSLTRVCQMWARCRFRPLSLVVGFGTRLAVDCGRPPANHCDHFDSTATTVVAERQSFLFSHCTTGIMFSWKYSDDFTILKTRSVFLPRRYRPLVQVWLYILSVSLNSTVHSTQLSDEDDGDPFLSWDNGDQCNVVIVKCLIYEGGCSTRHPDEDESKGPWVCGV